jgi:uncharacterized protein (TIGR00269 family)
MKCGKRAVTFISYNGTYLCEDHFIQYFERRVKKEIRKQGLPLGITAVALSGGKDSLVTTHLLHDILKKDRERELKAITIDEGIKGYRPLTIDIAKRNCDELGIEHHIISFKEIIGYTLDEISNIRNELAECTYCGVFRRYCINKTTREMKAKKIAFGHNLDDYSQSILMNFVNHDLKKLARLAPHKKIQRGLIPRIVPLRMIPEKEVMLYAILKGMDVYEGKCPYSIRAFRLVFREIVQKMEEEKPGIRYSILKSYDELRDYFGEKYSPAKLNKCAICGEPTSQSICMKCSLLEKLKS